MSRGFSIRAGTLAALWALTLAAGTAAAHHGNAAYDTSKVINITGTVTKWQFINPHAGIFISVKNADGSVEEWSGEFQSIQDLYRNFSWNKDTFKPGDEVTLYGNPERSGGHSVWTSKVVFADGKEVNLRSTYE